MPLLTIFPIPDKPNAAMPQKESLAPSRLYITILPPEKTNTDLQFQRIVFRMIFPELYSASHRLTSPILFKNRCGIGTADDLSNHATVRIPDPAALSQLPYN
jgi:hypothetical protein